jgi:predicted transcriptional regulator
MKMQAEAIASLIPSVRAEIARELVHVHKMSQQEAARMLGVSQPAVSQYVRQMRGARLREENVRKEISKICGKILMGSSAELESDVYSLCKAIVEGNSGRK